MKEVSDFAGLSAAIETAPHRLVMFAFDFLILLGVPILAGLIAEAEVCALQELRF